ncbi:MAG TPA: hypothetical protein VGX92_22370 [Pyrinomonadaceae bacterium]|jgi:hypothetical protein|nr:hypothetical protein [Pyrinomonadaceae bacterium]
MAMISTGARRVIAFLLSSIAVSTTLLANAPAGRVAAQERMAAHPARRLVICVDGVGFSLIERMRREGRFRQFREPSRMIAPFPTLTNVAMAEILMPAGALQSPGYEDKFFDVGKNRMRGGLLERFQGGRFIRGTFRELFDYHPSAIKSGLGYAAPPLSTYLESLTDLVRLRQKFRASREPVFFAYTGATDSLAHLGGEWLLRSFMARLDDTVTDIIRDSPGPVEVTIFSDHGNHFRGYSRVELKSALRRAGLRIETRVRDERSVVFPQYGLVGSAVLFTRESNEPRLAAAVAEVKGVDFAAYERDGIVHLRARNNGTATIERRGESFRYRAGAGDPLGLNGVMRELRAKGKMDGDGFVDGAQWFEHTRDGARPDAVRRIYEGLTGQIENRANVILNLEDGYYTGSFSLDIFAFLQATHGNLGREQSFGFAISTGRDLPSHLRAEDVWQAIGSPRLSKQAEIHASTHDD